jgi:cell division protein FtsW (lipid II flippase)
VVVGLAAWLAMGVTRLGASEEMSDTPLGVITTHGNGGSPLTSFALAAGVSVVLVLAIHAPELALVPVLVLLGLIALDHAVGWTAWSTRSDRRGWILYVALLAVVSVGALAFSPWPWESMATLSVAALVVGIWLARRAPGDEESRVARYFYAFRELRHALFSGVGWMGVLLVLGALIFLNTQQVPPFVRFALVFMLFLLAIRAGLTCRRVLELPGHRARRWGHLEALGLLVIPVGVLLVFMLFDFGLGLVFFAPMFVTVLLAARIDRLPASLSLASLTLVAGVTLLAWAVLKPSLTELRNAPDVPAYAEAYANVGNGLVDGLRRVGLSGPVTRATVRSVAASDPGLLEEALAFAGPTEALMAAAPSREQVWGGLAYAASGWTGTGFAGTTLLGRGVPTAVSYAEDTFAVYVLSEHGALGGLAVLLLYLALLVVVGIWVVRVRATIQETSTGLVVLAMTVGGALWLTIPAVYVAASNLGLVPLTGQNMPFLGLNSWADVVLVSGMATGIVVALATHEPRTPARSEP